MTNTALEAIASSSGKKKLKRQCFDLTLLLELEDKVITTIVIGPLDDHRFYARSAFPHYGALAKAKLLFTVSFYSQLVSSYMCPKDIFFVDLQPKAGILKGGDYSATWLRGERSKVMRGWGKSQFDMCFY